MRILLTTDTIGGVWSFTTQLSEGLLKRGCSVILVSLGRSPSESQQKWVESTKIEFGDNFDYHALDNPLEWMSNNDDAFESAATTLQRIAQVWHVDIIHSSQFCFGALPFGGLKVITAHSDVLTWSEACRFGTVEDSEWIRTYRRLVSEGLSRADVVVAPTEWMLASVCKYFALPLSQFVIPNGMDIQLTDSPSIRILQAVTAGRLWDEAKDISLLGDVHSSLQILIAGEQSCDSGAACELTGVSFLGALTRDDLLKLFSESAIYICPSRYEPFGLSPLEAALCGCAVVARDIPSLREVWQDSALYFKDASSLSELLETLSGDPKMLVQASHRSSSRAKYFSQDRMTDTYLSVYRTQLARKDLGHAAEA